MAPASPLDRTLDRMDCGRALKVSLLRNDKPASWVPYTQPLLDAVSLFEELAINYALIGGIAAMYYGRARFTEDVDFVAAAGQMDVLASHPTEMARHHFYPTRSHRLYHQSGVQVDLWKDEHADAIIARALAVELAGRQVRIIDPHDLVAMKLRFRRLKDDYDISQVALSTPIDQERLRGLVTPEQFLQFGDILKR